MKNRCLEIRTELGLRQQDVAERAGLTTATVSKFERTANPGTQPIATGLAIARAMDVSIEQLVGEHESND
jgi:transcriptional regulator with XRE-family HTH domain